MKKNHLWNGICGILAKHKRENEYFTENINSVEEWATSIPWAIRGILASRIKAWTFFISFYELSNNCYSLPHLFILQIMWILISLGLLLSTLFDISAFSINTENQQVCMKFQQYAKKTFFISPSLSFQLLNSQRHYGGKFW